MIYRLATRLCAMSSNPAVSEKLKEVSDKITTLSNRTHRTKQVQNNFAHKK